jgi:hypothetical protein
MKKYANRSATLDTILMVEEYLTLHRNEFVTLARIRRELPRKMMHSTLKRVIAYLWYSGKVLSTPDGIRWVFTPPEHVTQKS